MNLLLLVVYILTVLKYACILEQIMCLHNVHNVLRDNALTFTEQHDHEKIAISADPPK